MKKAITKIILFICYCTPFVFLAMNEDASSGTLWFYMLMILAFSILCCSSIKTKNYFIVIIGNIASFASSYIFTLTFHTEKWEYYFKPFSPYQLILFESLTAFLIQIIFIMYFIKKNK